MKIIECPRCHIKGEEKNFSVAIRQGEGIVDVGFRCHECGAEFGFEHFKEKTAIGKGSES